MQTHLWARIVVVVVVCFVALLDVATGVWLLFGEEPWRAHGDDTVWTAAAARLGTDPALDAALMSLWHRVGAFSVFAGASTLVWLWHGWRDRRILTTLLVTYLVVGTAFGLADARWFSGTPYHLFKQAIGAAWVSALGLHLWNRPRDPNPQRSP
jgi:hypothetical protein